jgi:hypothetical protein
MFQGTFVTCVGGMVKCAVGICRYHTWRDCTAQGSIGRAEAALFRDDNYIVAALSHGRRIESETLQALHERSAQSGEPICVLLSATSLRGCGRTAITGSANAHVHARFLVIPL